MTAVSVLIPYRGDGGQRDRVWAWLRGRWADKHPGWELVVGGCPDGAWRKGAAISHALARASGDIVVMADADCWTDGITTAVEAVAAGAGWAIPHHHVHRLDVPSTARVLADGDLYGDTVRKPYRGFAGGGMYVTRHNTLLDVPPDPRFAGWGQEDEAHALALTCLAGQPWRGPADLFHLWHAPSPRLTTRVGSVESMTLYRRYKAAARSPRAMRALLAEAR